MVALKCHLSEDTFRKYGSINSAIYDICEHLVGEPAYVASDILVSDADDNGDFYICLGGGHNKARLELTATL